MISDFGNIPLDFEGSVYNLKEGGEGICTKDLSSCFLADQVVLLSGLTCSSMQCVDVCLMFTQRKRFSPHSQNSTLCSVRLLGESECKDAVKMSGLEQGSCQRHVALEFEGVSFRSDEALSLLGATLIELKVMQSPEGKCCSHQEGRDTCKEREREGQNRLFLL